MFRKDGKVRFPAMIAMVSVSTLVCIGLIHECWFRGGDDMGNFLRLIDALLPIPYQFSHLVMAHVVNAAIVLLALWRSWHRRCLPNGNRVVFLTASIFVWAACAAFEAAAIPLGHKVVWSSLEYLGMLATPMALLVLALEFGPGGAGISARKFWLLGATTFVVWLMVPTNSWHGLLWSEFVEISTGVVQYRHGPGYVVVIGYAYLLVLVGTVRFVRSVMGLPRHFQKMGIEILLALSFPLLSSLVDLAGVAPPGVDPAPLGFSLMGVALSVSLLGSRLIGAIPIVRSVVGDRMREAILVFDGRRRLVDFNPSAYRLMNGQLVIGMEVDSLESPWRALRSLVKASSDAVVELEAGENRWYEARSSVFADGALPVHGALVILYDISVRKAMEQQQVDTAGGAPL